MDTSIEDLDYRFNELKGRFEEAPSCYSATAQEHEFDFSALNGAAGDTDVTSMLKLTLDLQCNDYFNTEAAGEQSGTGSGMLFGKKDSNYSLALLLNNKTETSSGFGYYAKVTNKGSADETVNMIFAEARPSGSTTAPSGLSSIARIMAKPEAKVYEMAMAASTATRGNPFADTSDSPNVSCGFHAITNGTLVYVEAIDQAGGLSSCSSTTTTELCLNASDLSTATDSCATLKGQMTIAPSDQLDDFNYDDVTVAKSAALHTAMTIKNTTIEGKTSAAASAE